MGSGLYRDVAKLLFGGSTSSGFPKFNETSKDNGFSDVLEIKIKQHRSLSRLEFPMCPFVLVDAHFTQAQ